jgi:hypothetical protein
LLLRRAIEKSFSTDISSAQKPELELCLQTSRLGGSPGSHRYRREPGLAPKRLMNHPDECFMALPLYS